MKRQDKLNELSRAKERLHEASEKLIKTWEPMLKERKLKQRRLRGVLSAKEHIITTEEQIIIIMTDFPCDSLKDTKIHHKVCLWSKN